MKTVRRKSKRDQPLHIGGEVPLHLENIFLPADCDEWLSPAEIQLRRNFLEQVLEAFSSEPTVSGVVHGQRKIRLGKEGSRSSYFPSLKNGIGSRAAVYLPVESRLEARYALELERDDDVVAFRTQSVQLKLPGMTNPVFPDFMILDKAGYLHLREVKADVRSLSPNSKAQIEFLHEQLARYGITYDVVEAADLPSDKKYENLEWLYHEITAYPTQFELDEFGRNQFERATYGGLKRIATSQGLNPSIVPYLLFTEKLSTDWDAPINEQTEIWK